VIVILYIMDSLRADFLSCYGCPHETSPNIDELARQGVLFSNAFAQSTWTRAAGASILSSLYPSVHRVRTHEDYLPSFVPTLPERLGRNGFKTMAVTGMGNISRHFGFARGFDDFVELYKERTVMEKRKIVPVKGTGWEIHFKVDTDDVPIATSEDINEFVLSFLRRQKNENSFIFVWSIDTHAPYFHRDPGMRRFAPSAEYVSCEDLAVMKDEKELRRSELIYRDMIYFNDHQIGLLVEELRKMGLYEDMFLIITGDHGEAFGEHGVTCHGKVPHEEQIRVPLIMKFPFSRVTGEVSSIAQHIDIAPTVLDVLGIPADPRGMQGRSLTPVLGDRLKVNDYAFTEYQLKNEFPSYISIRTEEYKYIAVRQPEKEWTKRLRARMRLRPSTRFRHKPMYLFNLKNDPGEKVNILRVEHEKVKSFHAVGKTFYRNNQKTMAFLEGKAPRQGTHGIDQKPDEEVAKQLKALGYFE
jgi:arylsulfatase A-like enzyme